MIVEGGACGDDDEDRHDAGEKGPCKGIDLSELDILDIEPFVHDGALLKEYLPGGDGGPDIGHDDEDEVGSKAVREARVVKTLEYLAPGRARPAVFIAQKAAGI